MPPGSHSNPVPRMEEKMPLTKHTANHFSLVLKLSVEASRTCALRPCSCRPGCSGPAAASPWPRPRRPARPSILHSCLFKILYSEISTTWSEFFFTLFTRFSTESTFYLFLKLNTSSQDERLLPLKTFNQASCQLLISYKFPDHRSLRLPVKLGE